MERPCRWRREPRTLVPQGAEPPRASTKCRAAARPEVDGRVCRRGKDRCPKGVRPACGARSGAAEQSLVRSEAVSSDPRRVPYVDGAEPLSGSHSHIGPLTAQDRRKVDEAAVALGVRGLPDRSFGLPLPDPSSVSASRASHRVHDLGMVDAGLFPEPLGQGLDVQLGFMVAVGAGEPGGLPVGIEISEARAVRRVWWSRRHNAIWRERPLAGEAAA